MSSKKRKASDSKKKSPVTFLMVTALLLTAVTVVLTATGTLDFKKDVAAEETENTIRYKEALTFAEKDSGPKYTIPEGTTASDGTPGHTASYYQNVNVNNGGGNTGGSAALENPSGWSASKILQTASDAIAKTKAYKGNLQVQHSESFDADVKDCTGGSIVETVVNVMIGWVVKPVTETLSYNNGTAVNSEGEAVGILLPKDGPFTLSLSGLSSATAKVGSNEYVITLNLVNEHVGMYEKPTHNASAIGYLNVSDFDISFLTVDSCDINYKGSSVELHINPQGYVTYAKYTIPLTVVGAGHKGSISGSVTFDGVQTEVWDLNW